MHLFGTVLPVMVCTVCLLPPRYQHLTGSATSAVLLGGLTYAAVHVTEGWTRYDSPVNALLSLAGVLLQFGAPGIV